MLALLDIKRRYKLPIKRKFEHAINEYINNPDVQLVIKHALDYKLTENDYSFLIEYGQFKGKYPYLNWLCTVYIHPFTIAQECMRLAGQILC